MPAVTCQGQWPIGRLPVDSRSHPVARRAPPIARPVPFVARRASRVARCEPSH
jgi:hypothetical protein